MKRIDLLFTGGTISGPFRPARRGRIARALHWLLGA